MRIMLLSYIVKFLKALLVIKYMILLKGFFFHLVYIIGEFHLLQSCLVCSGTALAGRTCICVPAFFFDSQVLIVLLM